MSKNDIKPIERANLDQPAIQALVYAHLQAKNNILTKGVSAFLSGKHKERDAEQLGALGQDYLKLEKSLQTNVDPDARIVSAEVAYKNSVDKINQAIAGEDWSLKVSDLRGKLKDACSQDKTDDGKTTQVLIPGFEDLLLQGKDDELLISDLLKNLHKAKLRKALKEKKEGTPKETVEKLQREQTAAYFKDLYAYIEEAHFSGESAPADRTQTLVDILQSDPYYQVQAANSLDAKINHTSPIDKAGEERDIAKNEQKASRSKYLDWVRADYRRRKAKLLDSIDNEKYGKWGKHVFAYGCGLPMGGFTIIMLLRYMNPLPAFLLGLTGYFFVTRVNAWVATNAGTNVAGFVKGLFSKLFTRKFWAKVPGKMATLRPFNVLFSVVAGFVWGAATYVGTFEILSELFIQVSKLTGSELISENFMFYSADMAPEFFWIVSGLSALIAVPMGLMFTATVLDAAVKNDKFFLKRMGDYFSKLKRVASGAEGDKNYSRFRAFLIFTLFAGAVLTGLFFTANASKDPIKYLLGLVVSPANYKMLFIAVSFLGAFFFYFSGVQNTVLRGVRRATYGKALNTEMRKVRELKENDPLGLEGPDFEDERLYYNAYEPKTADEITAEEANNRPIIPAVPISRNNITIGAAAIFYGIVVAALCAEFAGFPLRQAGGVGLLFAGVTLNSGKVNIFKTFWGATSALFYPLTRSRSFKQEMTIFGHGTGIAKEKFFIIGNGLGNCSITIVGAIAAGINPSIALLFGLMAAAASIAANNRGILGLLTFGAVTQQAAQAENDIELVTINEKVAEVEEMGNDLAISGAQGNNTLIVTQNSGNPATAKTVTFYADEMVYLKSNAFNARRDAIAHAAFKNAITPSAGY